jgi:integrase
MKYPTGVENHGGTLRIWFIYKGFVKVWGCLTPPKTENSWRAENIYLLCN